MKKKIKLLLSSGTAAAFDFSALSGDGFLCRETRQFLENKGHILSHIAHMCSAFFILLDITRKNPTAFVPVERE